MQYTLVINNDRYMWHFKQTQYFVYQTYQFISKCIHMIELVYVSILYEQLAFKTHMFIYFTITINL